MVYRAVLWRTRCWFVSAGVIPVDKILKISSIQLTGQFLVVDATSSQLGELSSNVTKPVGALQRDKISAQVFSSLEIEMISKNSNVDISAFTRARYFWRVPSLVSNTPVTCFVMTCEYISVLRAAITKQAARFNPAIRASYSA